MVLNTIMCILIKEEQRYILRPIRVGDVKNGAGKSPGTDSPQAGEPLDFRLLVSRTERGDFCPQATNFLAATGK